MGKVTRKCYGTEFKAKVALEAINGRADVGGVVGQARHSSNDDPAWKQQAIDGLASTFSGKAEAVQATGEAELTRLHAKIGQW